MRGEKKESMHTRYIPYPDLHGRRQHVVVRGLHEYLGTVGAMLEHGDTRLTQAGASLLMGVLDSHAMLDRLLKVCLFLFRVLLSSFFFLLFLLLPFLNGCAYE